jgi:cyclic pyranopterin monophosphate synthase
MMNSEQLTHFNAQGEAHLVDVGTKQPTKRVAVASGQINVNEVAYNKIMNGNSNKGNVFEVARIAAIQAAKQASVLIPLCHPLALTHINVKFATDDAQRSITIRVQAETVGPTGVEMEALTAVSIGLLTIYDMLKAVDRGMVMTNLGLEQKEGGKSGMWIRE